MRETKKLKEELYKSLESVWTIGGNIPLDDDVKKAIWGIVSWKFQSVYNKGRIAGWKKGYAEGIIVKCTNCGREFHTDAEGNEVVGCVR